MQIDPSIRNIAVASGEDTNLGKSTLARHLLRPRLAEAHGSCEYLLVEKLDREVPEGESERYSPENMKEIQTKLAKCSAKGKGSVVLDIGGGQCPAFISAMRETKGSEARLDLIVMPVTPTAKIDKFIESVNELILLGVEPNRIAVVINLAKKDRLASDILKEANFLPLVTHQKEFGYRIISAVLPESDVIKAIRHKVNINIDSMAAGLVKKSALIEFLLALDVNEDSLEARRRQFEDVFKTFSGEYVSFDEAATELWKVGKDKFDYEAEQVYEFVHLSQQSQSFKVHLDIVFRELVALRTRQNSVVEGMEVQELDLTNLFDSKGNDAER